MAAPPRRHGRPVRFGGRVRIAACAGLVAGVVAAHPAHAAPTGPPSSSYSTSPEGVAAYASLLEEFGHEVERHRGPLAGATFDPATTAVLLDPPASPSTADLAPLRDLLDAGGTVVAGGSPGHWVADLVSGAPEWGPDDSTLHSATASETAGVARVESAGEGAWTDSGDGTVVVGAEDRALVVRTDAGSGSALLLADVSPLQNRLLADADNAALGLALAGGEPTTVVFLEGVHGYGPPEGLSAVPAPWRWACAWLVLAAATWMWARGTRPGPPEEEDRALPPPRRDYVEALAATLARTRRRERGAR